MRYSTLAVAAPLFVTYVSAYGNSVIKNSCSSPVYFWEDKGIAGPPLQTITPGNSFTKELYQTGKANGAGPSFKLARARDDGSMPELMVDPITQFEYTVNAPSWPGSTSFDISNVNGAGYGDPSIPSKPPFIPGGVGISSPQDSAASRTCPAQQNPCTQGYTGTNDNWAVVQTDMGNDIVMEICGPKPGASLGGGSGNSGGNSGSSSSPASSPASSSAASPPPSSSAPASSAPPPVQEKMAEKPKPKVTPASSAPPPPDSTQVVWVTEYAPAETVVVHVNAKRDEVKEKREEHLHNHAHAHNKINKRRHGA